MEFKAALFDMDGLIFDTEVIYKTSWKLAAAEQGLVIEDSFYQTLIGTQDAECERRLIDYFEGRLNLERFKQVKNRDLHARREQGVDYKQGFDKLFALLQKKGVKCALVTSSALPEVKHNFGQSGHLEKFDIVITSEDVENGKPHPDCYMMACEQLGIEPGKCLVLEDSNNGIRSGLDAGCVTAMIPDLLPPNETIRQESHYILESLNSVQPLFH